MSIKHRLLVGGLLVAAGGLIWYLTGESRHLGSGAQSLPSHAPSAALSASALPATVSSADDSPHFAAKSRRSADPEQQEHRALIDGTSPRLRRGVDEMRPDSIAGTALGGQTRVYRQYYRGLRVYNAGVSLITDRATNEEYTMGSFRPGIDVSVNPTVSASEAVRIAVRHLRLDPRRATPSSAPELFVYPATMPSIDWRLAWAFHFPPSYSAVVDAHSAEVLFSDDGVRH